MKLGNGVVPAVALAVGVVAGVGFGLAYAEARHAAPAYVLVSGRVVDEDGLAAYGEAAGRSRRRLALKCWRVETRARFM